MAEGAPLLREYGVYSLIEGSNPSCSASTKTSNLLSRPKREGVLSSGRLERTHAQPVRGQGHPGWVAGGAGGALRAQPLKTPVSKLSGRYSRLQSAAPGGRARRASTRKRPYDTRDRNGRGGFAHPICAKRSHPQ